MTQSVLILDDDQKLTQALASEFIEHGYHAFPVCSISEIPKKTHLDFAVLDVRLSGEFGLNAIEKILSDSPACKIVVLSGYGSVSTAVEAVKKGAINYLLKPAGFSQIEAALLEKEKNKKMSFRYPSLSQIQNEYIDFVLVKNDGNISKTAKDLGIHRQSLQRKLKKYS